MKKKLFSVFLILVFLISFITACNDTTNTNYKDNNIHILKSNNDEKNIKDYTKKDGDNNNLKTIKVEENKSYTSKDEVALYIYKFKKLPSNFITKSEAKKLGWDSSKGNLGEIAKGKSIGGDKFSNREKILPTKKDRKYIECDIDYNGGFRGSKRIVFSNDSLIYYTEDHYKTFTLLYGDENK